MAKSEQQAAKKGGKEKEGVGGGGGGGEDMSFLHQVLQRTADLIPPGRDLLLPSHLC